MGAASKRRKAAGERTETEKLRSAAEAEAAAMRGITRESLQSAAEAQAAATMEDRVERENVQGAAEAEAAAVSEVAQNVWVAEVAMGEGMAERSLKVAVVKAARNVGTAAEKEAVRAAAEAVVAGAMQVRDMEEALAEIEDAVQAMGWAAAEQAIMSVAQEVLQGAEESMELGTVVQDAVWVAILQDAHAVVVGQALTIEQVAGGVALLHVGAEPAEGLGAVAAAGAEKQAELLERMTNTLLEPTATALESELLEPTATALESKKAGVKEGETAATKVAETAAHLEAAAESSSTGGGSCGVATEVAEALSTKAAGRQQAAAHKYQSQL